MMGKIRIIKKNDEYSPEYEVGDIIEITGTWYGGVHVTGKSGVPVSLDKEEYVMLDTEPEEKKDIVPERDIAVGDIVQHLKREWVSVAIHPNIYIKYWPLQHIQKPGNSWLSIRVCTSLLKSAPDRMPCL